MRQIEFLFVSQNIALFLHKTTQMRLLFISFLLVGISSCKKQGTWDSDWTVPIINDELTLASLVEDSIVYDENGTARIRFEETIYSAGVGDIIPIPDTTVESKIVVDVDSYTVNPGWSLYHQFDMVVDADPVQLQSFKIKSGTLKYRCRNVTPTYMTFHSEFPYSDKNGQILAAAPIADPGSPSNPSFVEGQLDLAGFWFDLRGEQLDTVNSVFTKLKITTASDGPAITITRYDTLYFTATLENVVLESANGYFGNDVQVQTVSQTVDLFKNIPSGTFDLSAISTSVQLSNGLKAPAQFKLISMESVNAQGNNVSLQSAQLGQWLPLTAAQINGNTIVPGGGSFTLDETNSNIIDFIESKATTVNMTYEIQLNPIAFDMNNAFIGNSAIGISVACDLKANLALSQLVLDDTLSVDFTSLDYPTVIGADLQFDFTNRFPLNATAQVIWLDANYQPLPIAAKSIEIQSSAYGAVVNGLMEHASTAQLSFVEHELLALKSVQHVRLICTLNTNTVANPTLVSLPTNGSLGVKARLKVKKRSYV